MFSISGRSSARSPNLSLSTRGHIESLDAGLTSAKGAQEVIAAISSRRFVTKLILGHNELGDEGCKVLFVFLNSEQGRKYQISEIGLNSNGIGDAGLLAISQYLRHNTTLRELFLQNNAFTGNADVTRAFALALNSSHLETLSLTTNPQLSDHFLSHFFPILDTPYLGNVQLSVLGLTHLSGSHIIEYITSPRCRLHTLHANGNRLGLRAARAIIRALSRSNFTLLKLELYANGLADPDANASDETAASSDEEGSSRAVWQDSERELKRSLLRNAHLKRETEKDALALLRYARAVLLRPPAPAPCAALVLYADSARPLFSVIGTPVVLVPAFPFVRLPTELQLHVLAFLAPALSAAQRIRICTYAASPATLPVLLPAFPGLLASVPASMATGYAANLLTRSFGMFVTMRRRRAGARESAMMVGSSNTRREQERAKWLALVRCNAFELEDGAAWIEDGILTRRDATS